LASIFTALSYAVHTLAKGQHTTNNHLASSYYTSARSTTAGVGWFVAGGPWRTTLGIGSAGSQPHDALSSAANSTTPQQAKFARNPGAVQHISKHAIKQWLPLCSISAREPRYAPDIERKPLEPHQLSWFSGRAPSLPSSLSSLSPSSSHRVVWLWPPSRSRLLARSLALHSRVRVRVRVECGVVRRLPLDTPVVVLVWLRRSDPLRVT